MPRHRPRGPRPVPVPEPQPQPQRMPSSPISRSRSRSAPEQWAATPAHQPVWLSDAAVKLAVREASASAPLPASSRRGQAYGADSQYRQFDLAFAYARRPDCLHPDGLKFQPAALGQIELDSEFAIPFWIAAIAKGKCNFGE